MRPPQYRSLQVGRGIAAFLVLIHHAGYFLGVPVQLWHREAIFRIFSGFKVGVEIFFVLSGIVIFTAHQKDLGRPVALFDYLKKRARRIYPIYWIVLLGWFPLYMRLSSHVDPLLKDPQVIVTSILLVHVTNLDVLYPVAWTLFHEVLFYAVFAGLIASRTMGATVFGAWVLLSLPALGLPSEFLRSYLFSPLHILFALGLLVVIAVQRQWVRWPRLLMLAGAATLIASIAAAPWLGSESLVTTQAAGLGSALLFAGAMALEWSGALPLPPWMTFIGDASYSTYLVHWPAMTIASRFLYPLSRNHGLSLSACFVILVLCGQAAGCLLHLVVERPLLKWLGGFRSAGDLLSGNTERKAI